MRKFLPIAILLSCIQLTKAGPGNYYNSVDTNQTCSNLKTALFNLISIDSHLDYGIIDNNYYRTDSKLSENGSGRLTLVERYCSENPTGLDYCFFNPDSICSGGSNFCQCFNKEHVVPKAWFNGSSSFSIKQYTDMHYLWPSDSKTNGAKSNFPLGYVKTADVLTSLNGTKIGTSDPLKNYNYNFTKVFEPIDSFKGDFARAYLYFVTRYQDSVPAFIRNNIADSVFSATSFTDLKPWILQLCVKWHKLDPPSAFEHKRNDSVFAIQGNRNPYIDFPSLVEKVFGKNGSGNCTVLAVNQNRNAFSFSVYPNPIKDGFLTIETDKIVSNSAVVQIIDIVGRKLLEQKITTNNQFRIDVSNLEKGTYLINIVDEENNSIQKFIKE